MQEELNRITEDFKKILNVEDTFKRFNGLGDLAKETGSSQLPEEIKSRILRRINENQLSIAGHLDISADGI